MEHIGRERKIDGGCVLLQILPVFRARNGNDVFALRHHPSQRELARRHTRSLGKLFHFLYQFKVAPKVLALKPWTNAAIIAWLKIIRAFDSTRQEASAQWAISHKRHAEFPAGGQDLRVRLARPQ